MFRALLLTTVLIMIAPAQEAPVEAAEPAEPAQPIMLDLMLSPVMGDRSNDDLLAMDRRVHEQITTLLAASGVAPVRPDATAQQRAQVRWRFRYSAIEEQRDTGIHTVIGLEIIDTFSAQRPARAEWSLTIKRSGGILSDNGSDLKAALSVGLNRIRD